MQLEMKLIGVYDDTVLEAIKTLPLEPEQIKLSFYAHGISLPCSNFSKKDYLQACEDTGIKPFSKVTMECFLGGKELFINSGAVRGEGLIFPKGSKEQKQEEAEVLTIDGVLEHSKYHIIALDMRNIEIDTYQRQHGGPAFKRFKDLYLETLVKKDYTPEKGELILRYTGDDAHDLIEVSFGKTKKHYGNKDLKLKFLGGYRKGDKELMDSLINWISGLNEFNSKLFEAEAELFKVILAGNDGSFSSGLIAEIDKDGEY